MKKRIYAILFSALSLFFAGIGIQKFYLGQIKRGILYVLFFWTFIPYLLCIIDLLKFIFMSDEQFNLKYNRDYYNEINYKENYYDDSNVLEAEYSYTSDTDKERNDNGVISEALNYYNLINDSVKNIKDYEFASYVKQLNALFKDIINKASECDDEEKSYNIKKDLEHMIEYNIPTTLKLINYYVDLEDSNADNINNVKKGIKESIAAVIEFLKNVLNKIHENDIMDINSDIDVLKTTLRNNGYM
ncbi:TM2 domain-containing protein [uncultured Brachyspira sp.]|uniref:TM2 domain-containing protein n=1 Tax=uncultured Brachyspira sp. TaxID=221953 RepID=UPI002608693A|nr:TM2 domain-containing protein [uncultured Brachyspira sp.]